VGICRLCARCAVQGAGWAVAGAAVDGEMAMAMAVQEWTWEAQDAQNAELDWELEGAGALDRGVGVGWAGRRLMGVACAELFESGSSG